MSCFYPTYMGVVSESGNIVPCTSARISETSPMAFYDGIYGLNDVGFKGYLEGGGLKPQRGTSRPTGKIANAQLSFMSSNLFLEAAKRGLQQNVKCGLFCGKGYDIDPSYVNSYSFSCSQGGVPEINVELIGFQLNSNSSSVSASNNWCNNYILYKWSDVQVEFPGVNAQSPFCPISINFSIQNSFTPIYTKGSLGFDYMAAALRPKIQDVTGSITFSSRISSFLSHGSETTMSVSFPGYFVSMKIVLLNYNIENSGNIITTSFNFQGIDYAFG